MEHAHFGQLLSFIRYGITTESTAKLHSQEVLPLIAMQYARFRWN